MIKKFICIFFILLIPFFLSSCGLKYNKDKAPVITDSASEILNEIKSINTNAFALKGLAELRVKTDQYIKEYNIAYASDGNKKLRIEVLSPIGMPVMTITYDGKKIYFHEDKNSKIKTYSNPDKVIQKITNIDFNIKFICKLISSKIILIDFNKADAKKNTLILTENNIEQKISFDKDFSSGYKAFFKENNKDLFQVVSYKNNNFEIISLKNNTKLSFIKKTAVRLTNKKDSNIFRLTR
ncbi:MAG: hypothetical protein ACQESP_11420 [Candidatus Muiribacteriota bacterium]